MSFVRIIQKPEPPKKIKLSLLEYTGKHFDAPRGKEDFYLIMRFIVPILPRLRKERGVSHEK